MMTGKQIDLVILVRSWNNERLIVVGARRSGCIAACQLVMVVARIETAQTERTVAPSIEQMR